MDPSRHGPFAPQEQRLEQRTVIIPEVVWHPPFLFRKEKAIEMVAGKPIPEERLGS